MEKILVTGSTGFIGGNLVQKLSLLDYEIHVIERYISRNTSNISYPKNVIRHSLNLYDYSVVHKLIKDLKPSYVINLAAISPVSYSYEHPLEVLENNFLASVNLAECCEKDDTELKQFITASTSEVYGLLLQDPDSKLTETGIIDKYGKETDLPPLPNSPYAVGKLSFDHYLKYMGMAYDFPYTIMRPFNTYGRLNNQHFFIENAIKQMMSNSDKIMLGEKGAIRDWMYVDDHVQAYLDVISNKQSNIIFSILEQELDILLKTPFK